MIKRLVVITLFTVMSSSALACPPKFLCSPAKKVAGFFGMDILKIRFASHQCDEGNPGACYEFAKLLEKDWRKRFPYKGKFPANPLTKAPGFYIKNGVSLSAAEHSCEILNIPIVCGIHAFNLNYIVKDTKRVVKLAKWYCQKFEDVALGCLIWLRMQSEKSLETPEDVADLDDSINHTIKHCEKRLSTACRLLKRPIIEHKAQERFLPKMKDLCVNGRKCAACETYRDVFKSFFKKDWKSEFVKQNIEEEVAFSCERKKCQPTCDFINDAKK